jgi:hypothetical protein
MTTALARQQQALLPDAATLQTMLTMAEQLVASGLLPQSIKTPAAALAVIQKGVELGIPPMYALSNIGIINGRPVVGAEVEVVDGEIVVVDQKPAPTPLRTVKPSEVVEPTDEENERARAMVRGGEVGASTAATEAKTTARAKLEASLKRGIEKARSLKLEVADLEAEKLSDQEIKDALGALAEMVKAAESGADAF